MFDRSARALACVVALTGTRALAAGFEIPELGAVPMAQGGTGVASFGTSYGLLFNPAGIAWNEGLDVRFDLRVLNHAVSFTRASTESAQFFETLNQAGPAVSPVVAVSFRPKVLLEGRIAFGLGMYPPAGVSRYLYDDPGALKEQGAGSADINAAAGQRYALIESNTTMLFPTATVAYRIFPEFALGLSFRALTASIGQRLAIGALPDQETTDADATVDFTATNAFIPSFAFGAGWELSKSLHLGASFKPGITVTASGPMNVALPEVASSLGYAVEARGTKLQLNLPPEARIGASYIQDKWRASGELVYQGWSANDVVTLTPDVTITKGGTPQTLAPVALKKEWHDSFGARVGGSYALVPATGGFGLDLSAGALFESNAIPSKRQSIDYVTGHRIGGSVGATCKWNGFALTLSAMAYAPVTIEVTDSEVARASSEPETPIIVGNGTYTSNILMAGVGLAYSTPAEAK